MIAYANEILKIILLLVKKIPVYRKTNEDWLPA
jgi:hypothetical protein